MAVMVKAWKWPSRIQICSEEEGVLCNCKLVVLMAVANKVVASL